MIGVYDADGTVLGELSYFVGKRLGRTHCGLCDITHGVVRERAEWRLERDRLPVPFDVFHRDDQPDEVRATTADRLPSVLAEMATGNIVLLVGPAVIDRCAGSPAKLIGAIRTAVTERSTTWPRPTG